MAKSVREIMTGNPVTLPATATVQQAAARMRDDNIGDVLIAEEGGRVIGIATDRDITIRAVADGADPTEVRLSDVVSADLVTVAPDDTTEDAARRMRDAAVRRAPVMQGDQAIGIVSIGDLAVERDPDSALGDISAAPPNQ